MHVIYVDDEKPALENFRYTVKNFEQITSLHLFDSSTAALEWAETHPVEIAFLDIEMPELNGVCLAQKLREIHENVHVFFVTAYSQYALDAFAVEALGYILKPYTANDIRRAFLRTVMFRPAFGKKVVVETIPTFHVMVDGEPLRISRAKCRELLALLVDRAGRGVTSGEAISCLWPDRANDKTTQSLFRMTYKRLAEVLTEAGIEEIIGSEGREKFIRTDKIDCDLYRILNGDKAISVKYAGEYMREYSWAEFRNAQLSQIADVSQKSQNVLL